MKTLTFIILLLISDIALAMDLPQQHELKQNEAGQYYVVNKDDVTMIEASIVKLGYNARWILACIEHESIDSDLIRWVFVDTTNGGTFDSINKENWAYFRDEAYPGLKTIKLESFSDKPCP